MAVLIFGNNKIFMIIISLKLMLICFTDPVFTSNDIKRWYAEDKSKGCTTSESKR